MLLWSLGKGMGGTPKDVRGGAGLQRCLVKLNATLHSRSQQNPAPAPWGPWRASCPPYSQDSGAGPWACGDKDFAQHFPTKHFPGKGGPTTHSSNTVTITDGFDIQDTEKKLKLASAQRWRVSGLSLSADERLSTIQNKLKPESPLVFAASISDSG